MLLRLLEQRLGGGDAKDALDELAVVREEQGPQLHEHHRHARTFVELAARERLAEGGLGRLSYAEEAAARARLLAHYGGIGKVVSVETFARLRLVEKEGRVRRRLRRGLLCGRRRLDTEPAVGLADVDGTLAVPRGNRRVELLTRDAAHNVAAPEVQPVRLDAVGGVYGTTAAPGAASILRRRFLLLTL